MKVELSQEICGHDGKALINGGSVKVTIRGKVAYLDYGTIVKGPDGKEVELVDDSKTMTVAEVFMQACMIDIPREDDNQTGEEKTKRYNLAETFFKNQKGSAEIDAKDIVMLQARINKIYPNPAIYAGIDRIINPDKK